VEESFNFSGISALVIEPDRYSAGIVGQILRGFGVFELIVVTTGEEAKKLLESGRFHLLVTESLLPDVKLAALMRWVRRHRNSNLRFISIVVLTGYTQYSWVTYARDAGANSVVRKPVAPITLFDHILWSAKLRRPFIDADHYAGPCRRFRSGSSLPGQSRRVTDSPSIDFPSPRPETAL